MATETSAPIGQLWLHRDLRLPVPGPAVESHVAAGARRTELDGHRVREIYPRRYAPEDTVLSHLRFALRHEAVDPGVLAACFEALEPKTLATWVRAEPTGGYSRRAWFLYEALTGRRLDLPDAGAGNYVPALDPAKFVVAGRRNSPRHRVVDNLLGGHGFCPFVRRTPPLEVRMASGLDRAAEALLRRYEPALLARAVDYLFTKETRASFAIEHETPGPGRTERFVAALKAAPRFDPTDQDALIRLQNEIVDPRYAASGWRDVQIFVGQTVAGFREEVHFVCPKPEDVPALISAWTAAVGRLRDEAVDPVVAAAVAAFGFVFIHPFEDGNGRLHRFLVHHMLSARGFGPDGLIFPVSASMLRERHSYDAALERFSRPLLQHIDWAWTLGQNIVVRNETRHLYAYFDATSQAEYLYDRVADTVHRDLEEELGFLATFDRALVAVREIVDMPDRRASLFVRLCLQNGGRLASAKRRYFAELSDAEVEAMQAAIRAVGDAPAR